ncbi:hypothetical protein CBS101457_001492 [Exobasidium rhododendri]|nr:hypothetical protein CBS101457_001492 [Exobasidium rhododendri]
MSTRQLFGGAISAEVEGKLIDASDLRQVPDNQEVLLGVDDNTTIIVEVLESVKEGSAKADLEDAIRFHFNSLAHDNSATSSEIIEILSVPGTHPSPLNQSSVDSNTPTPIPLLVVGEQTIQKFGREKEPHDRVRIYLALWRLTPAKDVDLVLSLNEPILSTNTPASSEQAKSTFLKAAQTLRIKDWNLFAS